MWASSRLLMFAISAIVVVGPLAAQDLKDKKNPNAGAAKKDDNQPDVPFQIPVTQTDAWINTRAWLACLGQSPPAGPAWNPYGVLGARVGLSDEPGLPAWQFVFDECLPIWHRYLESIRDGRPLPSVERKELKELATPDWGMYLAMVQGIDRSHLATLDMFKKSAADKEHVGYRHLKLKPAVYRGQIITVAGRINRVEKFEAMRHQQTDIQFVYFTEIFGPFKGEPPFAVLFTELPAGVAINKMLDMEVTFHGYFLAHVLFAGDAKRKEKDVVAPYLVGKTLIVDKIGTPPETESYAGTLIVWTVGGIVCVFVVAALLNFWFRRGDRQIEAQLAKVRDKHQPFNVEPAEPEPPLADPVPPPSAEGNGARTQ
jgi:hypothetical protein